jgi:membrane associated rhomboid family serine protease
MELNLSYFYLLIGATVILSLIGFSNHSFFEKNKFVPYLVARNPKEWFRIISSGFLHADFMHLLLNMYVFYSFGSFLSAYFIFTFEKLGNLLFLILYITSIIASHIPTLIKQKNNGYYASIGASGAVSAITFSYILINPTSTITMLMGIHMPAILFGIIYLAAEYFLGKRNNDNINHDAHFWGAVYGFAFTGLLQPNLFVAFINQIKAYL